MKLSTKSRYGLRALFDIAYNSGNLPVQVQDISRRQAISPRYLEQIFQSLKRAGILKSKRGPQGGYYLAGPPAEISLLAVIQATEGDVTLVECGKGGRRNRKACQFDGSCVTQAVWNEATARLSDYFSGMTLQNLCEMGRSMGIKQEQDHRFTYHI